MKLSLPPLPSILFVTDFYLKSKSLRKLKGLYLTHFNSKWKNKTTFFSQTLKVGENKVVLFFHFGLKWARYSRFYFLQLLDFKLKSWNRQSGHISLILAQNLKLSKLKKIKWSYFFIWRKNDRVLAIFMFPNIWLLKRKTRNQENGYTLLILAPNKKLRPLYSLQF